MGDYQCVAYSVCAGPVTDKMALRVWVIENRYVSVVGCLRKDVSVYLFDNPSFYHDILSHFFSAITLHDWQRQL